jgi:hypothetical protein
MRDQDPTPGTLGRHALQLPRNVLIAEAVKAVATDALFVVAIGQSKQVVDL